MHTKNTAKNTNLQAALSHAREGWPVFPCKPDKSPLVKWRERASTDEDQIKTWWRKWPDAMAGLPMGRITGLAVLDLDKRPDKDGAAALRDLGLDPESMSSCVIDTPSGGQHIYFQWHEGLGNSAAGLPAGVDVRGEGGYVIASGSENATGAYSGNLTPDLPLWPEALRPARSDAPEATSGECDGLPMHHVKEALMSLPNDGDAYANRDDWLNIGAALHHETDGSDEGLDLFQEWSGQHPTYDEGDTESVWQSFGGFGKNPRTFATIRAEAESHGWIDLSSLDDVLTADELAQIDALIGMPETPQSRLCFLSPSDCETMPARRYVVKGLLAEGDVGCIVGAPGAGKSLVAPFIGYAVAQGERVFGHRTRAGGVLYVAAEDSHGMRGRVKALKDAHGDAEAFLLVDGVSDLLNSRVAGKPSPDLGALQEAVKNRKPALVVVDTIAMAFPALEENDAKSMGQVVAAARSLTKWGAAVLLIHHDTKEGSGIARGHSILNGALDMSLHIKRDGGVVVGNLTKNRNGTTDQPLAFTVKTVTLGEDEDGDAITTAMCQEADAADAIRPTKLSRGEKGVMGHFEKMDAGDGVAEADLRNACLDGREVSTSPDKDSRRRTLDNALRGLTGKGVLTFQGAIYSRPAELTEAFTDDMVSAGGETDG